CPAPRPAGPTGDCAPRPAPVTARAEVNCFMLIGCPRETKNSEYRVGLTPESTEELVRRGHEVWIETDAGLGIGADDERYRSAGATIIEEAAQIFERCEMIVKVKEPQPEERQQLREGQILYAYLHLRSEERPVGNDSRVR